MRRTLTISLMLICLASLSACGFATLTIEKADGTRITGTGLVVGSDVALGGLNYKRATGDDSIELSVTDYKREIKAQAMTMLANLAGLPAP